MFATVMEQYDLGGKPMQKISDIIKPRAIYWVKAEDNVKDVVRYMCERQTGAVAVMNSDEVVGIFSERDVLFRVVNDGLNPAEVKVKDVMTSNLIFITMEDEVKMAKALMHKNNVRHLIVVGNENKLKGLVSMRDLNNADMEGASQLIQKLNDKYYEEAYKTKWRKSSNRVIMEPYET